jgi:hypothetical protein
VNIHVYMQCSQDVFRVTEAETATVEQLMRCCVVIDFREQMLDIVVQSFNTFASGPLASLTRSRSYASTIRT